MRVRLYICDVCEEIEDKKHGGAFYTFKYKEHLCGFTIRHKIVMCNSCFTKMFEFCRGEEKVEWNESEEANE